MKFGHIEIFVGDVIKSKVFYEKVLGFEITEIQQEKFVWMKSGSTEVLLRPGENKNREELYNESNTGFVLYTDNVFKKRDELISLGLVFSGTDGSDECLTFTDPDGNWFQLVNPQHS